MSNPYTSPTLATIAARVASDVTAALIDAPYLLMRLLRGMAVRSSGGASWGLHQAIEAAAGQANPLDATEDGLDAWGSFVSRTRNQATYWTGVLNVYAAAGSIATTGDRLVVKGGTALYELKAGHTWGSVSGYYPLAAQAVDAGTDSNLDAGDVLSFVTPPSGVNTSTYVYSVTAAASDEETDDTYRVPVLAAFRGAGAQGGTADDYEAWALAVAGVYSAAATSPTPATVDVVIAASDGAEPEGPAVPDAALLSAVTDALALKQPVDDTVTVTAWSA